MGFHRVFQDLLLTFTQVALEPEPESTVVYKKVWKSSVVKSQLANYPNPWLYDERKLAW